MRDDKKQETPFLSLGKYLKRIRQKHSESVAEVSGAVEIDIQKWQSYEDGVERPSEDILLLLISHFGISSQEAEKIWEMAGYDQQRFAGLHENTAEQQLPQNIVVIPFDARIAYTDSVNVSASEFGVTIDFLQTGATSQPLAISRVGMSKEMVRQLMASLASAIQPTETRSLPASTDRIKKKNHKNKD